MKHNPKYNYVQATQLTEHGSRTYDISGMRLPSVTTILAKTKNQAYLNRWRNKVGHEEATIIDFKQANRPKKQEWIKDYYMQIAAYAMAHDYIYGSSIRQGIIMVCTPDLYMQEFRFQDADMRKWKHKFLKRLDEYYEIMRETPVNNKELLAEFEKDRIYKPPRG